MPNRYTALALYRGAPGRVPAVAHNHVDAGSSPALPTNLRLITALLTVLIPITPLNNADQGGLHCCTSHCDY